MTLSAFTLFHVALSLVGIFSGFVVMFGLLTAKRLGGWTAVFLASTVLAVRTGRDNSGPVRFSFGRSWAPDLCHRLGHRPLSQRFCVDRPVFHEDSGVQSAGAHAIRASVSRDAGGGHVDFRCSWDSRN